MKRTAIFLILFFISGGCGLIYEVLWTRLFITVIGNTVFSVSAILSVFMAGLALGSRLAGRRLDRQPVRLIRAYALLEASIGVYNLALPLLLMAVDPVFGVLYRAGYDSFLILAIARLLIVFLLLIIPSTLMGATLPILIRFYVQNVASIGSEAGRVYSANTWGAALGTAAAGFLLIPWLGVMTTLVIAAGLNLAIAGVAWFLARSSDAESALQTDDAPVAGPAIVLAAMMMSGFAALMNEVAWTRVLGLVVGPTTYAFTLMLVSMITGLGSGAAIGSLWVRRRTVSLSTFAMVEVGVGLASIALIPAFGRLPIWIGRLVTRYVESFATIQLAEFLIFFSLMLVPTTLLGMTFPIAARLYARSNSLLGTEVSAVYAFNTVGGILGSLAAGFILIPWVGSQWTLVIASIVSVAAAVLLARRPVPAIAAAAVFAAAIMMPRWDPELMASGAYKYAPYYSANLDLESTLKSGDILYFKEGATTTVSAKKFQGNVMLAIDGKVDATDSGDMTTQKMLGHLPLLLSRAPKNVAVIGLGSGVTAGAALQHPIEALDIVEISPEVVEASRFFDHVNHKALEDPRTRLIVGDGRNHVRYIDRQYDVTISEPSNPWMSGMASLFSREFFGEVLAKLTPSGIHCQWFHSYNMSTDDLRTVIRTFRSVFPHAQLWALNENDFLLLGSPAKIGVDEETVNANFQRISGDLKTIKVLDLYSVLSLYLLEDEDLDTFAGDARLNTDDYPILEFRAPKYIYANTTAANFAALQAVERKVARPSVIDQALAKATAENHRNKGQMFAAAESFKSAVAEFRIAVAKDKGDEASWRGIVENARSDVDRKELAEFFDQMLASEPRTVVRLAASDLHKQESDYGRAVTPLKAILAEDPRNLAALEKLADIYASQGSAELPAITERLLALDAQNSSGLYHLATIRFYQGRHDEAIQMVSRVLEQGPGNTRARNLLAIAYGQTFQAGKAEAEFRKIIEEAPDDYLSFNNYGLFLAERGRFQEAVDRFSEAINIEPDNVQGYVGIGEAYRESGQMDEAQVWYRKALQLDPNQRIAKLYIK